MHNILCRSFQSPSSQIHGLTRPLTIGLLYVYSCSTRRCSRTRLRRSPTSSPPPHTFLRSASTRRRRSGTRSAVCTCNVNPAHQTLLVTALRASSPVAWRPSENSLENPCVSSPTTPFTITWRRSSHRCTHTEDDLTHIFTASHFRPKH